MMLSYFSERLTSCRKGITDAIIAAFFFPSTFCITGLTGQRTCFFYSLIHKLLQGFGFSTKDNIKTKKISFSKTYKWCSAGKLKKYIIV